MFLSLTAIEGSIVCDRDAPIVGLVHSLSNRCDCTEASHWKFGFLCVNFAGLSTINDCFTIKEAMGFT